MVTHLYFHVSVVIIEDVSVSGLMSLFRLTPLLCQGASARFNANYNKNIWITVAKQKSYTSETSGKITVAKPKSHTSETFG